MTYESKTSFGLKNKLLTSMMIAGILPLVLGMVLSYVQGNKSLRYVIGSNFETLARETANKIDFVIDREIAKNHQTTLDPNLIQWVEKQNASLTDPAKFEADFINSSQEAKERAIQSAIENTGTQALLIFLTEADHSNESTRALFVSSIKGVLVSSINDYPTFISNLDKRREKVLADGVYLSNIYWDEKIKDHVFELVLPIFNQREKEPEVDDRQNLSLPSGKKRNLIGLLHRVFSAKEYFKSPLETIRFGDTGHLMIIDGKGVVIDCPILPTGFQIHNQEVVKSVTLPEGGWVRTFDNGHGSSEESIMGFSPLVKINSLFEKSSGAHWHMFAWQASEEIFAPTRKLLFWNTGAAAFGIILIALIGTYAANKITRPVHKLQKALIGICDSSLDPLEIQVETKDEIGELTSAFNKMSRDLRTTRESELRNLDEMEKLIITLAESESRISAVMNNVVEGIITIDHQGTIESFNPAAERIFGYKADEVKGKNVSLLMPEPDKSQHDKYMENYLKTGVGKIIGSGRAVIAQRKDGSTFHMDLAVGKMMIGNQVFFVGVMRDITQRISMEADLRKLSLAVEQSPTSVLITDAKGNIEYVNPNFVETSGYSYEEALGKKPSILKSGIHPQKFYEALWDTILSGKEWRQEFCNRKKNGDLYWELQSISPLRDSDGNITHFLAVKIDDTERKRAEEQLKVYNTKLERSNEIKDTLIEELQALKVKLEISAKTDPLTGLSNRRGVMEKIEYEKLRFDRSKRPFTFILADIDHFKKINDTYGHDAGDFILRQVAQHFKDALRGQDTVCRWGGEEFLVLLPETDLKGTILLAEKLRARIEMDRFEHNSETLQITMSFGLSLFDGSDQNIDSCIKRADECLYAAKTGGRNRVMSSSR